MNIIDYREAKEARKCHESTSSMKWPVSKIAVMGKCGSQDECRRLRKLGNKTAKHNPGVTVESHLDEIGFANKYCR